MPKQNVNFMAKLKVSRSDPSLPLLQGEGGPLAVVGIKI